MLGGIIEYCFHLWYNLDIYIYKIKGALGIIETRNLY